MTSPLPAENCEVYDFEERPEGQDMNLIGESNAFDGDRRERQADMSIGCMLLVTMIMLIVFGTLFTICNRQDDAWYASGNSQDVR